MKESTENISLDTLRQKIEAFKLHLSSLKNKDDFDFSTIQTKLLEIFSLSNYYDNIYELKVPEFWRARQNSEGKLFFSPKDFEYPKWNEIPKENWKYDRFNLPGESMWYLSNNRDACISEIRPGKGSIISCAQIKYTGLKYLKFLLLDRKTLKDLDPKLSELINEAARIKSTKHSKTEFEKLFLVDELMNWISTRKVNGQNRFEYLPSIVIQKISEKQYCDGIIYPSIAYGQKAFNYVLFPRAIDQHFAVDRLITFAVVEAKSDSFFGVAPLLVGKNIYYENRIDSQIKWQYPSNEEIEAYSKRIELKPEN